MRIAVELGVDIADGPAETLDVYLGGVGVGRAGPAPVASTMLMIEVLLNTSGVVAWAFVGELTLTLNTRAPKRTMSATK